MIIEISFNSDLLDFTINELVSKYNSTYLFDKFEKRKGKILLSINMIYNKKLEFVFLNIFKKNDSLIDNIKLNNYAFKYSNVKNEDEFLDYKILYNNDALNIEEKTEFRNNNSFIECSFNKIDIEKNKANITYFLKAFDSEKYIKEESYESIAIMESPFYTVYEKNPSDNNGIITLRANINFTNTVYFQVIALIEEGDDYEYISYKGFEFYWQDPEQKEEEEEEKEEEIEEEEKEEEEKEEEEKEKEEEKEEKEEEENEKEQNSDQKNNNPNKAYIITICILSGIIVLLLILIIIHFIRKKSVSNQIEINDIGLIEPRQMN